jgi:hypothetical protein
MRSVKAIFWLFVVLLVTLSSATAQDIDTLWTQTYWNGWFDSLNCVQETSDHGFIMTGVSWAEGESQTDIKLVRADSMGVEDWSILIGDDTHYENGYHVLETHDGGYLISGSSDLTAAAGVGGIWVVRTNSVGDTLWTVPWCPDDRAGFPLYACHTSGGGYAITGVINLAGGTYNDCFILIVDDDGVILDAETYGDYGWQSGEYIAQVADGGFYVAGKWDDTYGSQYDWWVLRTNAGLTTMWDSVYALSDYYDGMQAACLVDDGVALAGTNNGVGHAMKVDLDGHTIWSKTVSIVPYDEAFNSLCPTDDGGFMTGGWHWRAGHRRDFTMMKLDSELETEWWYAVGGFQDDHGQSLLQAYDGNWILGGPSNSFVNGQEFWLTKIGPCCQGQVGDVNGNGEDEPTIGDVSLLIDALFISVTSDIVPCFTEADVNQSGGLEPEWSDVTIGDLTILIDYLFISVGAFELNECL